ncbi:MAG TPA: outer membrane beta-barrel protein [Gemmatimonadales bacterium]|nr:outer membrane beta-barrel protein [Gemmatimonadales bacterium]
MRQTTLGLTLALVLGAMPAAAQVRGLPVYNSGIPTGLGFFGDLGFPNTAAGKGTTFAGTARLGAGPFGVTGTLSRFDGSGLNPNLTGVGGTVNYKFFGGPLVPLTATLQAGLGYDKLNDVKSYHVPVGVGFALTIPNPVLAIKPWIAPRVDVARTSVAGTSSTNTNFGLSAGVEFNLLNGVGLHAAYDRLFVTGDDPNIFAAGLHYQFRVPGL